MQDKQIEVYELTEHLFRVEYGKIASVLSCVFGVDRLLYIEDAVQEAFYKAMNSWPLNGIPNDPSAWLFVTAKRSYLNVMKSAKHQEKYLISIKNQSIDDHDLNGIELTDKTISDGQLKMMLLCCHSSLSRNSQLCLILKILCGFSIVEIARAFKVPKETINKRLVRARKKLRENSFSIEDRVNLESGISSVLQAIFLLFNEGYSPSEKNEVVRKDLCFEAIRLTEIIKASSAVKDKNECFALLSLMYLNTSRFESRVNDVNEVVEMKNQNREIWNQELINRGIKYLNKGLKNQNVSLYQVLATISAVHGVSDSYDDTDWHIILKMYDVLLLIQDTPLVRLNRCVALAKVNGNLAGINELRKLALEVNMSENYLFYSTLAEFHKDEGEYREASENLKLAILVAKNERDVLFLQKKLSHVVPV